MSKYASAADAMLEHRYGVQEPAQKQGFGVLYNSVASQVVDEMFGLDDDDDEDEDFGRRGGRRGGARRGGGRGGRGGLRRRTYRARGRQRARRRWGGPGAGNVGTSHPTREALGSPAWQQGLVPGQDWGAPAPMEGPYPEEESDLDAQIDQMLASDELFGRLDYIAYDPEDELDDDLYEIDMDVDIDEDDEFGADEIEERSSGGSSYGVFRRVFG